MIDFTVSDHLRERCDRIRLWVQDVVVPFETDERITDHGPNDDLRSELIALAREAGLLSVQAPLEFGGWGPTHLEQSFLLEAAGWSILGPVAMNCAAPDEANMYLLSKLANESQAERYLRPLYSGERRSAFAMTEPDGAGSDPSQLRSTATSVSDGFVINGKKWLITGAVGAEVWIVMADLEPSRHHPGGPTLFLTHGDRAGLTIERRMGSIDRNFVEGHSVVALDDLLVPEDAVLGEIGGALRHAQMRLGPARLTHCARWLGAAARAQDVALDHARHRTAFGRTIGEHQGVAFQLAENEIAMHSSRLMIQHACWTLDQGNLARHETSIAKARIAEELFRVGDRCVQVLGGIGVTDETVVSWIFSDLRAFRLYDGPTEVHLYAIARRLLNADSTKAVSR